MNSCKAILSICMQNIRKWCKDYRIWSIAILLVIIIQIYVDDIKTFLHFLRQTFLFGFFRLCIQADFSFFWQPARSVSIAVRSFDCPVSALQAVIACPLLSCRLYAPHKVHRIHIGRNSSF